jgi:peroxiredoxin
MPFIRDEDPVHDQSGSAGSRSIQKRQCWRCDAFAPKRTLLTPATLVVERDGFIRARFVDPDFQRGRTVEELIDALKEAQ